jgi:RND family efflux transporter MFP subunit
MQRRYSFSLFAFLLLWSLLAVGCYQASKGSADQNPEPSREDAKSRAAIAVTVVKPKRMTLQWTVQGPGYIQAYEQTPMFAKIAGYVQKWHSDIGDHVSEGQVLAELWIPEMEVELKQKEALVTQADAELKLAKQTVAAAEAEYRRLKSQYERLARIGQSGTIDKEQVEEAKFGFEASTARRDMALADVEVKSARLEVAKRNWEQVNTLWGYRKLTAPFDGIVTRRNINTRDFVQPPTGGKGEPLYVVERRDKMRVFVPVPEADAPWVRKGVGAQVRVQALPGQQFTGEVARTSYSLDRAARTLQVEIDLDNSKDLLRPNMYAYGSITLEQPNALTAPASAVVTQGDVTKGYESYCFLAIPSPLPTGGEGKDGRACKLRRILIQTGTRASGRVEVLKKQEKKDETARWVDFSGDELIVQEDITSLSDGEAVTVSAGESKMK